MVRFPPANTACWIVVLTLCSSASVGAIPVEPPTPDSASIGALGQETTLAVDSDDVDLGVNSSATHWAGQRLSFNATEMVDDVATASAGDRRFQLRRVADDDALGGLVQEFVVDTDGEAVVDTTSLDGEYVITYDGDPVYARSGVGYTDSPPDGTTVTVEAASWEVAEQTISVSWSDDRVFRDQVADLRIESNRATFLIEVSADGLDFDDLQSMFDAEDYAPGHDAQADDDVIVLRAGRDADLSVAFADVDDGRYTLRIDVADADASTSAAIRVGRPRTTTVGEPPTTTTGETPTSVTPTAATTSPPPPTDTETEPSPTAPDASTPTAPAPTTTPGQFGLGILLAMLGILISTLIWLRRRR